jgi:sugar lactone lactonase YvrE
LIKNQFVFFFLLKSILEQLFDSSNINTNSTWKRFGITIAGGNGKGNQPNQFNKPIGISIDDDLQCIYIADCHNHRIVQWNYGATNGEILVGRNGCGNGFDQLNQPMDMIVDKMNNSIIVADVGNRRIIRCSGENYQNQEILISNIDCSRLTMDHNGNLYVSNWKKDEIRRWKIGDQEGTLVAGGNGRGSNLNQFNAPTFIFVDQNYSVYVLDWCNHRIMKWLKGAKEGIIVAGGQGEGNSLEQLDRPQGFIVDHLNNIYVADCRNNRIMRWSPGLSEGSIVVGGTEEGNQSNQLNKPTGLSFDREGNLYVVDGLNHRVQKFDINRI